MHVINYTPEI